MYTHLTEVSFKQHAQHKTNYKEIIQSDITGVMWTYWQSKAIQMCQDIANITNVMIVLYAGATLICFMFWNFVIAYFLHGMWKCKFPCLYFDIPVGSADFTIYTPSIGTLSYTVSSPLGRIQHTFGS